MTLPPLPTARFALGAATAQRPKNKPSDCVYALGGVTVTETLAIAEAFAIEGSHSEPKPKLDPKHDAKPEKKPNLGAGPQLDLTP
ncbi:hypothetical protein [Streptomyces sp. BF23-19]|uniref:hypothetical protein n=1 Tax=unclassified Streptomyces TaxID=2593676 RepID=UPI0034E54C4A